MMLISLQLFRCASRPAIPSNLSEWRVNIAQKSRSDAAASQACNSESAAALHKFIVFFLNTAVAKRTFFVSSRRFTGAAGRKLGFFSSSDDQEVNGQNLSLSAATLCTVNAAA
eukprot:CAMPEP_0169115746 /NCGR_PEP_ID=MMETSP1015-20121227/29504_1 /TAXON_ID=342587 /ORGANISM="Karlodinium micrum, Strain CCMP2283" /LENGTH=112 /DNA_ID=CAMNT_0009178213 /DNA_START=117 /DNA_END=455 /DNA_ORIENTATION=+